MFFWKKHPRANWYPSHLRMKDQGRKLSCENDKLQRFLCLLVLLLDTYFLEKPFLHVIKKIAVRPSKVQQPRKYTLQVLTSIPESPSMSGTRTSATDLIYLNSLTATAWLTVSRAGTSERHPFPISQIKASVFVSARLAMIPGTPCMLENWKHPNCMGTPEVSLKSLSFGHLHENHNAQYLTLLRAHHLLDFTTSWSTLFIYIYIVYMLNAQIFLKTDQISWKCATLECKPPLAKHASLKTSFSLIPSPSSLFIAVVKLYCLILACWMVVRKHTNTQTDRHTDTDSDTDTHTHIPSCLLYSDPFYFRHFAAFNPPFFWAPAEAAPCSVC